MKRYKLLKDTPCAKAGTVFEEGIDDFGIKVLATNEEFHYQVTVNNVNNFDDWFEEIPKNKRWRAENGRGYYFVNCCGEINNYKECGDKIDNYLYAIGNYSQTDKGLEAYKAKLIAQQVIEDDTKGFKPDWGDESQPKYHGYFSHGTINPLIVGDNHYIQSQGTIYFRTREDVKESFEKHRKEWLTVLGVEEQEKDGSLVAK